MIKRKFMIGRIPAVQWGEDSKRLFVAVHGKMSHKEDRVISILGEEAVKKGYQLISFDLPEHGERTAERDYPCNIQNAMSDLEAVLRYSKGLSDDISLFACSLGAFFSLMTYKEVLFRQVLFLSPIVNMLGLIRGMMLAERISEEELREKGIIPTSFGEALEWDYYDYVRAHPISRWQNKTSILYGELDEMIPKADVVEFCGKWSAELCVLKGSKHFFHTDDQLAFFRDWLKKEIMS